MLYTLLIGALCGFMSVGIALLLTLFISILWGV